MKLFVGRDRLLCKPEEAAEETEGGVVIPSSAREAMKSMRAEVVQSTDEEFEVGDIVYFGKYAGSEVEVEGTTYIVISTEEVLVRTTGS